MSAVVNALLVAAFYGSAMATFILPTCPKYSHLFSGHRQLGDRLVFTGEVKEPSELMYYAVRDFHYPQVGDTTRGVITRIEAIDNKLDGTGGCPHVHSGGVSYRSVHIRITSWWNMGIDYHINIYGVFW